MVYISQKKTKVLTSQYFVLEELKEVLRSKRQKERVAITKTWPRPAILNLADTTWP